MVSSIFFECEVSSTVLYVMKAMARVSRQAIKENRSSRGMTD